MILSVIVALDRNGLIGNDNGMPWHLPADLRRFRELTWGKPIIMGRTTHEHIGRPLPGRTNIVLSRNTHNVRTGSTLAQSLDDALQIAGSAEETFIIGGGQVYREALPRADRLYMTVLDDVFSGTTFFPIELIRPGEWFLQRDECFEADEKNAYRHRFIALDRARPDNANGKPFDLAIALKEPFATR